MALGVVEPVTTDELEALYRNLVASVEGGRRAIVVAEVDGQVAGMAHLAPSEAPNATHRAEVQRVAVRADLRGSGVGRALMAAVEDEALRRDLALLWLTTHAGTDAEAFYESVGYTSLGVMPGYSQRPDGTLWPGAFYYRLLGDV